MDLKYFKEQIHEELEGARTYIDKAIEAKVSNPEWVSKFVCMADAEADHAGKLMGMLERMIKSEMSMTSAKEKTTKQAVAANTTAATPAVAPPNPEKPEVVYKNLMKEFGETMTYVTNMKRGL